MYIFIARKKKAILCIIAIYTFQNIMMAVRVYMKSSAVHRSHI